MSHIQSGLQFPKNVNGRQFAIHDFGKRDLCVCTIRPDDDEKRPSNASP